MAWSNSLRKKIYDKFNSRCAYCGCGIKVKTFEIDHKFPKSRSIRDGLEMGIIILSHNQRDNLMPSCPKCNQLKGNLLIEDFRNKMISRKIIDKLFFYER